jgi:YbbR domain-containing protein
MNGEDRRSNYWDNAWAWLRIVAGRNALFRLIIALGLALVLWGYVVNADNPDVTHTFANIPVETKNLGGDFILGNNPGQISVEVRANRIRLETLTEASLHAFVDLSNLAPGVHSVPVQVDQPFGVTEVGVQPATVQVEIEARAQKRVPVEVKTVDSPPFGYELKAPQYKPTEVTVSGPGKLVDRVTAAVVTLSVQGRQASINGSQKPVPMDANGNVVDGVIMTPASVSIILPIELQFGYKTVPVKPSIEGQPATGSFMSSITVDPDNVTIVGDPNLLAGIDFLSTQPVNVADVTTKVERQVDLILPGGVSMYKSQPVTVTVDVSQIQTAMTVSIVPKVTGLDSSLHSILSPTTVTVKVSGSPAALQSLQLNTVEATLDVTGLGEGTYDLTPKVSAPDSVVVSATTPGTVQVTLLASTTSTPTPTGSPAPSAAASNTPTPTPTPN